MKFNHILILTLVLRSFAVISQTPAEDPAHWVLDLHDDFSYLNETLWNRIPNNTWGLETYDPDNVIVSNGTLTLKCEKFGSNFISGGVETVTKRSFSYGYFEIESKIPVTGTRGPWGGFWLHTGEGGWDELDIFEPSGCDTEIGTQFHSGVSATHNGVHRKMADVYTGFPDLSATFNKYAAIWTPKYVRILFNGTTVYEAVDPLVIPTHEMFLFLTFQIYPVAPCEPNPGTFPTKYWQFKNFKYYKLKTDCANGITATNFNFAKHNYKVQKFYSLTNSTVPTYSTVVLRATDYIELYGDFTVPLGSIFTATVHRNECPN